MLRIGVMCHSSCGGSSRIAVDMAGELAQRGHKVHLLSMNPLFFPPLNSQRLSQNSLTEGDLFDKSPSYLKTDWLPHEIEGMIALAHKVISDQRLEIFHVHYALPFALIAAELKKRGG